MRLKMIACTVAFLLLLALTITSFDKAVAQAPCEGCTEAGQITKCNGYEAVQTGQTSGNCIYVYGTAQYMGGQTVQCTVTKFYNCEAQGGGLACPEGCPEL